jgi:hypothetical protein
VQAPCFRQILFEVVNQPELRHCADSERQAVVHWPSQRGKIIWEMYGKAPVVSYWRERGRHLVMIRPASHAKLTSGVGGKAVEIGERVRLALTAAL